MKNKQLKIQHHFGMGNRLMDALYKTVHQNKHYSIDQIAEYLMLGVNHLYKMCIPGEGKFYLESLLPLMHLTKDYTILRHLANQCGFLLVKVPKWRESKRDELTLQQEYNEKTLASLQALKTFFEAPTKQSLQEVQDKLFAVMEEAASVSSYCKKFTRGTG